MQSHFDLSSGVPITSADGAGPPERLAAQELGHYLAIITGQHFPVREATAGPHIAVGASLPDAPPLAAGAFLISIEPTRILLAGAGPLETLHAVYAFLERHCGCRWLAVWEGGEIIPRRTDLTVNCGAQAYAPAFSYRAFTNYPDMDRDTVEMVDWMTKNRFNRFMVNAWAEGATGRYESLLRPELVARGLQVEWGHHGFHFWAPPGELFAGHPEYFALVGGERRADAQLCTSNPALIELVAERIATFLNAHPEIEMAGLWPTDGFGWCECPNCLAQEPQQPSALYPPHPRRTDTYLRFVNAVAKLVSPECPGRRISALAYVNYVEPPVHTEPRPDVAVCYAPFQRCFKHPLDAPAECIRPNARYAQMLERWRAMVSGTLYLFEYLMLIDMCSLPYPLAGMLGPNFGWLAGHGIDGCVLEFKPQEWGPYGINAHLIGQLSWEPGGDVEAWASAHYADLYGPAAALMGQFWAAYRRDFVDAGPCVHHYDLTYTQRATDELLGPALGALGRARAKAAGEGERRHVAAVERDALSLQLLMRFGEWQRAMAQAAAGDATRTGEARGLGEEIMRWARAHGDTGAFFPPRIEQVVSRVAGK